MPAGTVRRGRALAWLPVLAACLAAPAAAAAAPAVGPPTPASLAAAKPVFPITPVPDARIVSIHVAPTPKLDRFGALADSTDSNGGLRLDPSETDTRAVAPKMVFAGVHYWQVIWRPVNPDGTTGDTVYEAPQRFRVPPLVRKPTIGTPYQDPRRPQFGVSGTVVTNGRVVRYECLVRHGRKVIFRARRTDLPFNAGDRLRWTCLDRRVPESLDGKRLTLTVKVTVGAKSASASRTFIAR